jgi:hypothetical protein
MTKEAIEIFLVTIDNGSNKWPNLAIRQTGMIKGGC